MTTLRKLNEFFTESKRVIQARKDGREVWMVKQILCCCKAPADTRKACSIASGHKTPCRCHCHSVKP